MLLTVQYWEPTTIWMARPVNNATLTAPPAVVLRSITASYAPRNKCLTLLSKPLSTASPTVGLASTQKGPTAEVSPIKTKLVCALNCDTCSSGSVSDCALCLSGFFFNPLTAACDSSCPDGYFADPVSRACVPCDSACLTCTGPGPSSCSSCSPHFFSSGAN